MIDILTKAEDPLFMNEVDLELVEILQYILQDNELKQRLIDDRLDWLHLKDHRVSEKINSHLDKYCWLKVESFYGYNQYSFTDLKNYLRELLNKDLSSEIARNKVWQQNKKLRLQFLAQHDFDNELAVIAEIAPLFAKWQDLRKENSVMSTYLHDKCLTELARRTKTDKKYLAYLDIQEIENFLQGEITVSDLQKREAGILLVFEKDKPHIFPKEEISHVLDRIINCEKLESEEVRGTSACTGKAKGKAKIIIKLADMEKMNQGDILVSTMTRPEHLPAMKKAAAIITNEGGITCHAAVVSRELGIPCIIGTKNATKIFQDRDFLEVDADNGIAKKSS
ncbi:MAG: hypothetical protein GF365_02270 [Candidatus Buchananbacteria bacterium]|nr:hypothetical protein [Candidatus Buchananbacteria bacterium]